jgi:hypothetical protein
MQGLHRRCPCPVERTSNVFEECTSNAYNHLLRSQTGVSIILRPHRADAKQGCRAGYERVQRLAA